MKILGANQPLSAGRRYDLLCQSSGSRPPATITWWKNGQRLERTKETVRDTIISRSISFLSVDVYLCVLYVCTYSESRPSVSDGEPKFQQGQLNGRRRHYAHTYKPFVVIFFLCGFPSSLYGDLVLRLSLMLQHETFHSILILRDCYATTYCLKVKVILS